MDARVWNIFKNDWLLGGFFKKFLKIFNAYENFITHVCKVDFYTKYLQNAQLDLD